MPAENSSSSSQLQVWNEFGQTFISILAKQSKTCSTPKFFLQSPQMKPSIRCLFLFIALSLKMGGKKLNVENKGEHKWLH